MSTNKTRKSDHGAFSTTKSLRVGFTPTGISELRGMRRQANIRDAIRAKFTEETGRDIFKREGLVCRCGKTALYVWSGVGYCRKCRPSVLPAYRRNRGAK